MARINGVPILVRVPTVEDRERCKAQAEHDARAVLRGTGYRGVGAWLWMLALQELRRVAAETSGESDDGKGLTGG